MTTQKITKEHIVKTLLFLNEYAKEEFIKYLENGGEKKKPDIMYKHKYKSIINCGFDTEDNSAGHVHLLVFYFEDGSQYIFYDKETALYFITFAQFKEYDNILLWCINTEYDIVNLSYGYDFLVDLFYHKGRFISGKINFNTKIKMYDGINFYSLSAEKVGELFGLKKLSFDFKDRKYNKDGSVILSRKEKLYCIRDAKIACQCGKFITDKFKQYEVRQSATIAATSLQIYLTHFAPIDFTDWNKNKFVLDPETIYKAYFGGRVEAFKIGKYKGNIKYVDFNSLYPFVMKQFLYPDPYSNLTKRKTADINNGIVSCRVKVKQNTFLPVLPLRYNKKLLFPVGTFDGIWIVQELNKAINENQVEIIKVYESWEYDNVIDLFSDYINHFYQERKKSKTKADKYLYKVLMNSLYGKFAERRSIKRYVSLADADVFDPIVYGYAQQTDTFLPSTNNVIISAYVTMYARLILYDAMKTVIDNGCELLYCDTDSIIYKGDFDFPLSDELGDLKVEHLIDKAEIRGAKYYSYQDKNGNKYFVCKGVPKYLQADMFKYRKVFYRKPIRLTESRRRKIAPNIWIDFEKKDLTAYTKRTIINNGDTKPILIRESKI